MNKTIYLWCVVVGVGLWSCKQKEHTETKTAPATQKRASTKAPPKAAATKQATAIKKSPDVWSWRKWSFAKKAVGSIPSSIRVFRGTWKVLQETKEQKDKRVLAQVAANAGYVFNVAMVRKLRMLDLELSVNLRAIQGKIDQGGGLVWRAKDANNYYVARYNPLEDNLRVYHVKQGRRTQLQSATMQINREVAHTLRVKMQGAHIQVFLDNKKYLDVTDKTFPLSGSIGVWTKADAHTYFDSLQARPLVSVAQDKAGK